MTGHGRRNVGSTTGNAVQAKARYGRMEARMWMAVAVDLALSRMPGRL